MSAPLSPEDVVRKFFDCYTNGRPEDFDEVVAPDYLDYGHTAIRSRRCLKPGSEYVGSQAQHQYEGGTFPALTRQLATFWRRTSVRRHP